MEKIPTYTTKTCRKTYFLFSTYTFIPSYTFIIFGGNFIPTRLFHPAQLLGRLEYLCGWTHLCLVLCFKRLRYIFAVKTFITPLSCPLQTSVMYMSCHRGVYLMRQKSILLASYTLLRNKPSRIRLKIAMWSWIMWQGKGV